MRNLLAALIINCLLITPALGASVDRVEKVGSFVCNVLLDNEPVKELDGIVVIPFDSEYKLLLKNNNDRRAVAKITIDGSPISNYGDIIIDVNSEVILERYIRESLEKGKKFKFVPLDDPGVDDPIRKENGLIKIEFKIEKQEDNDCNWWNDYYWGNDLVPAVSSITRNSMSYFTVGTNGTSSEPGATVEGSKSSQKFVKISIDLEEEVWVVEIKLRGIRR